VDGGARRRGRDVAAAARLPVLLADELEQARVSRDVPIAPDRYVRHPT
jgi:hypothetical protein